jgi:hypothetical protein
MSFVMPAGDDRRWKVLVERTGFLPYCLESIAENIHHNEAQKNKNQVELLQSSYSNIPKRKHKNSSH